MNPLGKAGFAITDDLGTTFRYTGGGAGGDDRTVRGEVRFEPALPSEAKSLTITTQTGVLTLPVDWVVRPHT